MDAENLILAEVRALREDLRTMQKDTVDRARVRLRKAIERRRGAARGIDSVSCVLAYSLVAPRDHEIGAIRELVVAVEEEVEARAALRKLGVEESP